MGAVCGHCWKPIDKGNRERNPFAPYCKDCFMEREEYDRIVWEILWDLSFDINYPILFNGSSIIIDPSDSDTKNGPHKKKLHIDICVHLSDARICLRSMADYARSSIYAFVDLNLPNYKEEFLGAIDRIRKAREIQYLLERNNSHDCFWGRRGEGIIAANQELIGSIEGILNGTKRSRSECNG